LGRIILIAVLVAVVCAPIIAFLIWTRASPDTVEDASINILADSEIYTAGDLPRLTQAQEDIPRGTSGHAALRGISRGPNAAHDLSGVSFKALVDNYFPTFEVQNYTLCMVFYYEAYRLEAKIDGRWHLIAEEPGTEERTQVNSGESATFSFEYDFEPGEYRMTKTIYCTANTDLQELFIADFIAYQREADPRFVPIVYNSFRAYVYEFIDSESEPHCCGDTALLVSSLVPRRDSSGEWVRDLTYVWDNDSLVVIGPHGKPFKLSDVRSGAIIEIIYGDLVLLSDPACIPGAVLVQVVG